MANDGTVIFSGENPSLVLHEPGSERVVAAVSYWRCVYSAAGDGNATIIWVDPEVSGLGDAAPRAIYTDNPAMARLVTERFTQHFGSFAGYDIAALEPTHARFFQEGDGRWYHRVVSHAADTVVELNWWDILEYQLIQDIDRQVGPARWDLATVICPCRSASISIDNRPLNGEVRVTEGGERLRSSAFLAFSETWRERG